MASKDGARGLENRVASKLRDNLARLTASCPACWFWASSDCSVQYNDQVVSITRDTPRPVLTDAGGSIRVTERAVARMALLTLVAGAASFRYVIRHCAPPLGMPDRRVWWGRMAGAGNAAPFRPKELP